MLKSTPRLLIVDDEQDSIALLLSYLENQDFDILVALDGQDGFAKALRGQPDLILLDVSMPAMDGFAVCKLLKEEPRTRRIPVIFLSGRSGLDDKLEGFASGCIDYITKPFSEAEVQARIRVHIQVGQHMANLETAAGLRLLENDPVHLDPDEVLFGKAARVLEQHLDSPPGLIEFAHSLGINERKLTHIFRRKVGMTVFEYLTELRLETARRLLENSPLQIQLVADRVGYRNAGDFTRAFRRRYGLSPRDYRRALGLSEQEAP